MTLALHSQTSPDGVVTEIESSKAASYNISCRDIGFLISVSCEPVRSDWVHGPTVTSEHIGPIIPGMLITDIILILKLLTVTKSEMLFTWIIFIQEIYFIELRNNYFDMKI